MVETTENSWIKMIKEFDDDIIRWIMGENVIRMRSKVTFTEVLKEMLNYKIVIPIHSELQTYRTTHCIPCCENRRDFGDIQKNRRKIAISRNFLN